jgi:hypothetical protein
MPNAESRAIAQLVEEQHTVVRECSRMYLEGGAGSWSHVQGRRPILLLFGLWARF